MNTLLSVYFLREILLITTDAGIILSTELLTHTEDIVEKCDDAGMNRISECVNGILDVSCASSSGVSVLCDELFKHGRTLTKF